MIIMTKIRIPVDLWHTEKGINFAVLSANEEMTCWESLKHKNNYWKSVQNTLLR